jgi:alpha-L-rhamnosidase
VLKVARNARCLVWLPLIAWLGCTTRNHRPDGEGAIPDEAVWTARWIVPGEPADPAVPNRWYCFRKSFNLPRAPSSAVARIAADSKYWLWINGKLVVFEGELKRGPNPSDTYYDEVDLSRRLVEGVNSVAILLWYWGKDGFSHNSSGRAGLVFQAELDGRAVESDGSWKCIQHPAYRETGPPHPNFRLSESNIRFDARQDLARWTQSDYDSSDWPPAEESGGPPAPPWNRLVRRPIPLWRDSGLLAYDSGPTLPRQSQGETLTASLPGNLSVTPYLRIDAPAGLEVRLQTDAYRVGGRRGDPTIRAEYVTREGVQEFESLAYMTGHSVQYEIPDGVTVLDLRYRETRYDAGLVGSFLCDDDFCTTLWRKARDTMILNMRDGIQDADRERAQWWGDAVNVLGQVLYACDANSHRLIRKAMMNLVDWRTSEGVLFSPVPSGAWNEEVPQQMLAAIGTYGFWRYLLFTADSSTARYVYPHARDYLALWETGPDGLVIHRAGDMDWADWGSNIDVPLLDNAWYYMALDGVARMAETIGQTGEGAELRSGLVPLREAFNTCFWTEEGYRSPGHDGETDDRGNGLAVVAGIADSTRWDEITDVLRRERHASPYLEKYALEALFLMGDTYGALSRMRARYKRMVESELHTLWEHWYRAAGSCDHGWAGGPLTLLSEYTAGVAPETPGFETYHILPAMGDLSRVEAAVPSPRGVIRIALSREDSTFTITLVSPPSTTAIVGLPKDTRHRVTRIRVNRATVWADGAPVGRVEGIAFDREDARHYRFVVAPGTWEFCAEG